MTNLVFGSRKEPRSLRERLDDYTIPEALTGCYICWCAPLRGYPMITDRGKSRSANRIAWEIHRGPIPPGLYVCHRCDNRACVNPDHLFLGTHAENMQDAARKGRMSRVAARRGEEVHTNKLTAAQVLEIFRAAGSQSAIAARYGVGQDHVSRIKSKRAWKHLHA